ncbi:MAG TPA: acyltransferase family protein [Acidimicrobiales bacterium]|nr:acyltransferase family protein [Acidimicrobiales bacterium]
MSQRPILADATAIDAATPPDRDRVVDLLRVVSLAVVVLGHWLLAAVVWEDGRLGGRNLLVAEPGTQWLTWVFQVMPLFFLAGGVANAASWDSARRRAASAGAGPASAYAGWLQARAWRLVVPAAAFAAIWTVVAVLVGVTGAGGATLARAGRLCALPLWFLAVYLVVVAAAPAALALHRRFGARVPVVLAVAVGAVDVAHWQLGVPVVGWLNFALVWAFAQQLGFFWRDGTLAPSTRRAAALAAAGLLALVVLTTAGGYPLAMVGGPGAARTNNSPPSLALVALAVWQAGLVCGLRARAARLLRRPRVWATVVRANVMAMTLYLWHLSALALAALVFLPAGFPQAPLASAGWWLTRPLWFAACAAVLAVLVVVFARVERRAARPRPAGAIRVLAGTAAGALAMSLFALQGFRTAGPGGLPAGAVAALAAAVVAVSGWRPVGAPAAPPTS